MKEIFQNTEGFNTVEIGISCLAGDLKLNYQLSDNPVQHIWQQLHLNSSQFKTAVSMSLPTNKILTMVNEICDLVGLDRVPEDFDKTYLNNIHSLVVTLSTENGNNVHLNKLNNLIHVLENKISSKYSEYNSSILFYSSDDQTVPLKEEHKLWLDANSKWGDLTLGYGTLGKDWLDVCIDDDNPEELALQTNISSETCLYFKPEYNFPKANETLFYRWAKKSNFNVPLDNLNKLALGRYFLGKLIIDETLLDYNKSIGDWYIPNHLCKLTWNRDIIGPEATVKKLSFYNDNRYQEMSIDHAQIRSII